MKITLRFLAWILVWTVLPSMIHISKVRAQDYVKSDFMVSDLSDYFYKSPQLSVNEHGEMVVVWETTGTGSIWFKTISSLGAQLGEETLVPAANSILEARVAHADSGNFMVTYGGYYDGWSVYGQIYDPLGNEIGDTLELQRDISERMNMTFSSLSSDKNNNFGVFMSGMDSMMVEKISGSGEFLGSTIVLRPELPYTYQMRGAMTHPGNFILVWVSGFSGGELRGLRYTSEGIPIGESFLVGQIEGARNVQDFALACDTSGNFAVVWATWDGERSEIYSQLFSAEGVGVGSTKKISDEQSAFTSANGEMSLDMDLDGKFVLAWPDTRGTDTSYIYLQQLDNLGVPVGGNFRATTINNGVKAEAGLCKQLDPSVKILHDTIYLAWNNYNADVHYRNNIFVNIQKWMVPDVTGTDPQNANAHEASIYPNPSAGIFSLKLNKEYAGTANLEIYAGTGMLVRKEKHILSGTETSIDLSDLAEGAYYLRISGASFHSTQPLIILK